MESQHAAGNPINPNRQSDLTVLFWSSPEWRRSLEFRLQAGGNEEKLFHRLVREGVGPSDIDLAILLAARTDKKRDVGDISMQTRMFWGRKDRKEFLAKKLVAGTEARTLFNELLEKNITPSDAQLARLRAAAGTRWRRSSAASSIPPSLTRGDLNASACNSLISPLAHSGSSGSSGVGDTDPKKDVKSPRKRKLDQVEGALATSADGKQKGENGCTNKGSEHRDTGEKNDGPLMSTLKVSIRNQLEYEQTKLGPEGGNAGILTRIRQLAYLLDYFDQLEADMDSIKGKRGLSLPLPGNMPANSFNDTTSIPAELTHSVFNTGEHCVLPPQLTATLQAQLQSQLHAQLQLSPVNVNNIPPQLQAQLHALQRAQIIAFQQQQQQLQQRQQQQRRVPVPTPDIVSSQHTQPQHIPAAGGSIFLAQKDLLFEAPPRLNMETKAIPTSPAKEDAPQDASHIQTESDPLLQDASIDASRSASLKPASLPKEEDINETEENGNETVENGNDTRENKNETGENGNETGENGNEENAGFL